MEADKNIKENGLDPENEKIVVAGKNYASFDARFLAKLTGWDEHISHVITRRKIVCFAMFHPHEQLRKISRREVAPMELDERFRAWVIVKLCCVLTGILNLLPVAGCGSGDSLPLEPVSGKVTVDGKPLRTGTVSLRSDTSRGKVISASDY